MSSLPVSLAPWPRWVLPALLALVALIFGTANLPWHLDSYDQAKQAYVSYEMAREGHWWFQHTPGGHVATKPPLAGWVSAGLAALSGGRAWDLAWRLPPYLCALVLLLLLARAGRQAGGDAGALLAAAAFGFNLFSPRLATLVRTDMMLTLCIFLIGYLIYEKIRRAEPWHARDRWMIFLLLLISFLMKGPIAYAFLLPGLVAFWWVRRRSPSPGEAWSGSWSWFTPLLFFALWVALGVWLSHDFYDEVVLTEFLGRFRSGAGAPHRSQPVYFYLGHLLWRFFPWSAALLAMAAVPEFRARARRDPALLWLLCWSLGGLALMSCIPSKRPDRIFPVLPPLCLLLAAAVPVLAPGKLLGLTRRSIVILIAISLLFTGAYVAHGVITGYRSHQDGLAQFGRRARAYAAGRPIAVLNGRDDGMLLYLGLTDFTSLSSALAAWRAGDVRLCVIPEQAYTKDAENWAPAREVMRSGRIRGKANSYLLIEKE